MRSIVLTVVMAIFMACNPAKQKSDTPKQDEQHFARKSDRTYFTFLQLNDVYEIAPIQNGKYGGMARVATVHKELLKENPNTLLVLAGDFLNPSLLGTMKVDGERLRGKQMVSVMNAMNFDLVAFGNHEFDLSYPHLQKRINESNFTWISENIQHKVGQELQPFYQEKSAGKKNVEGTFVKTFTQPDGTPLKIGFFSVCIPSNPKSYVQYGDVFEGAKKAYEKLVSEVDVVIGLTHLTIAQDKKLAAMLPGVPLIMGGHEHTNSYDKIGDVYISKADANAKTVYIHRLEYNPVTKKVALMSELKEINEDIAEDSLVGNEVAKWQRVLTTKIKEMVANPNEVVFDAKEALDARDTPIRSVQTTMGAVITEAMSFAFGDAVDCALVNGGSIRIDDVLQGPITAVDIFRVLPYGGAIFKVEMTGELLEKVLEYGKNAAGTGAYLQRYKAAYQNDQWYVDGKEIVKSKNYSVVVSDYLMKGFDIPILKEGVPGVLKVYKPTESELAIDIRKAVLGYLKQKQ